MVSPGGSRYVVTLSNSVPAIQADLSLATLGR